MSVCLSVRLSVCLLSIEQLRETSFKSCKLTAPKRSNSARLISNDESYHVQNDKIVRILRDFLKFDFDAVKNEAIPRVQTRQVECRADGPVPLRFVILPRHLSKVLRLPRKSDTRSYEVLRLSRKIILANLKISKMQPLYLLL